MTSIVRNISSLRVEGTGQIPAPIIEKPKELIEDRCEKSNSKDFIVTVKDEIKEERQIKPKREFSQNKKLKEKVEVCSLKSCDILSYEYEERDDENKYSSKVSLSENTEKRISYM